MCDGEEGDDAGGFFEVFADEEEGGEEEEVVVAGGDVFDAEEEEGDPGTRRRRERGRGLQRGDAKLRWSRGCRQFNGDGIFFFGECRFGEGVAGGVFDEEELLVIAREAEE